MKHQINDIVVVGGGAAGWLTAAILAAEYDLAASGMSITLVESPEVANVGVGEGTWPSMRQTLQKIGIDEKTFLRFCEASFKQGSKFVGWHSAESFYYHPFTEPTAFNDVNLASHWKASEHGPFDQWVSPQVAVSEKNLSPKQLNTPDYAGVLNYGYHLNAGRFIDLLQTHAKNNLGVVHISANVTDVTADIQGITALKTDRAGTITGDFFIDCSGLHSLLVGKFFDIPWRSVKDILFNDSAIAVQSPYLDDNAPVTSATVATANAKGWIWDIGLASRRGVGHVFSRDMASEDAVMANLHHYLHATHGHDMATIEQFNFRTIKFNPGYREVFWHKNCVAVGMSAGFIEPLEATALVTVEVAANMIARDLPETFAHLETAAARYNRVFNHYWLQIVDFLKLHYVLSIRTEDYWQAHRDANSLTLTLQQDLQRWSEKAPWHQDNVLAYELFPAASYQYVLYGMGFVSTPSVRVSRKRTSEMALINGLAQRNTQHIDQLLNHLASNRFILNQVKH